jgi:hypothetical protein
MEGRKGRGAWERHKRLPYCFNVNRTSQDHLLLGGNADVDKSVEWTEYNAGRFQGKSFLGFGYWRSKPVLGEAGGASFKADAASWLCTPTFRGNVP